MKEDEPINVLYRIKRGLSGYISFLAACEMNQAFSEYLLYEPFLRILTARAYAVKCEIPCPGWPRNKGTKGDQKKIDFDVTGHDLRFAVEVKWARQNSIDVKNDYEKLCLYHQHIQGSRSFLCVFGRKSHIQNIVLKNGRFSEIGEAVYAEFGITRYGCRVYEAKMPNNGAHRIADRSASW
jgi:hypothetical protein